MRKIRTGLLLMMIYLLLTACGKTPSTATTAFYYWKSSFEPDSAQLNLLRNVAGNHLYLRFFDIAWDKSGKAAYPDAIIRFRSQTVGLKVTPVIFIRNVVFERLFDQDVDSLVQKSLTLLSRIATAQHISINAVQFDCDWTLTTRDRYFLFLTAFKKASGKTLEATIRLHQVKYRERTGIPPVDHGVLMFYNMGKISANPNGENSIYNADAAAGYLDRLGSYPLPLDVALPAFSWSVHTRGAKITGLPLSISRRELEDSAHFETFANAFRAKNSFFKGGIYIKQNDIFKPEEVDAGLLNQAARQLAAHLKPRAGRTIIYFELANYNLKTFNGDDFEQATSRF